MTTDISFLDRNRDKNLIKHETLRQDELPRPGTLIAIDAEFVSMQQVGVDFRYSSLSVLTEYPLSGGI